VRLRRREEDVLREWLGNRRDGFRGWSCRLEHLEERVSAGGVYPSLGLSDRLPKAMRGGGRGEVIWIAMMLEQDPVSRKLLVSSRWCK
jgi:hypothetical protein